MESLVSDGQHHPVSTIAYLIQPPPLLQDVNRTKNYAVRCDDRRDDALITFALKRIQARPMIGKAFGLQNHDFDFQSLWVQDDARVALRRAPTFMSEMAPHRSASPFAPEFSDLMVVWPTGAESAVGN